MAAAAAEAAAAVAAVACDRHRLQFVGRVPPCRRPPTSRDKKRRRRRCLCHFRRFGHCRRARDGHPPRATRILLLTAAEGARQRVERANTRAQGVPLGARQRVGNVPAVPTPEFDAHSPAPQRNGPIDHGRAAKVRRDPGDESTHWASVDGAVGTARHRRHSGFRRLLRPAAAGWQHPRRQIVRCWRVVHPPAKTGGGAWSAPGRCAHRRRPRFDNHARATDAAAVDDRGHLGGLREALKAIVEDGGLARPTDIAAAGAATADAVAAAVSHSLGRHGGRPLAAEPQRHIRTDPIHHVGRWGSRVEAGHARRGRRGAGEEEVLGEDVQVGRVKEVLRRRRRRAHQTAVRRAVSDRRRRHARREVPRLGAFWVEPRLGAF